MVEDYIITPLKLELERKEPHILKGFYNVCFGFEEMGVVFVFILHSFFSNVGYFTSNTMQRSVISSGVSGDHSISVELLTLSQHH